MVKKPQSKIFPQLYAQYFILCRIDGGEPDIKLLGPDDSEGASGPDYVAHILVFLGSIILCPLYKLTLSDQVQIILQLGVSISDLV
jgi:hypothetical protein